MNEKRMNTLNTNRLNPHTKYANKNAAKNNEESYVIPFEAACSPEFSKGCIIMEEETDKLFNET